jgi:hypothetical protein
MSEVIRPLLLKVAALTESQQQQQQSFAAVQALLAEREAATEKALLEASSSKAAALKAAHEQHEQSLMASQQQHAQALAALQAQLVEREAAMEKMSLENERLKEAVAAANLRAGDAEVWDGAAEVHAADLLPFIEPPCAEADDSPTAPVPCHHEDVERMGDQGNLAELEDLPGLEDLQDLQEDAEVIWHEAEAGGEQIGDVGVGAGRWFQDADGMWHEEEEEVQMEGLQTAGPTQARQFAEQTREQEECSVKRARFTTSEAVWVTAPAEVPVAEGGRAAVERRATIEETMRENLALDQLARDRREVLAQRRQAMLDAEQAFETTALEYHAAEASVQLGEAGLQRRLAEIARDANIHE